MARKPEAGEFWAYRIGRKLGRPVTQVEVVEPPENRRVIIRHLDSDKLEEVPLQRLVVPWDESEQFTDDERKLQAVHDTPWGEFGEVHFQAILMVLDNAFEYPEYTIERWRQSGEGSLKAGSVDQLSRVIGMSREELLGLPSAFEDRNSIYHAPFVAAVEITKRFCENNPGAIAVGTRVFEEELRFQASGGMLLGGIPISGVHVEQELAYYRPILDLLRSWAGEDEITEMDEIASLRQEVHRLQNLISDIGNVFYQYGYDDIARSINNVLEDSPWETE